MDTYHGNETERHCDERKHHSRSQHPHCNGRRELESTASNCVNQNRNRLLSSSAITQIFTTQRNQIKSNPISNPTKSSHNVTQTIHPLSSQPTQNQKFKTHISIPDSQSQILKNSRNRRTAYNPRIQQIQTTQNPRNGTQPQINLPHQPPLHIPPHHLISVPKPIVDAVVDNPDFLPIVIVVVRGRHRENEDRRWGQISLCGQEKGKKKPDFHHDEK